MRETHKISFIRNIGDIDYDMNLMIRIFITIEKHELQVEFHEIVSTS